MEYAKQSYDIDPCVMSYMKSISNFKSLKKEEEKKLFEKYKKNNDLSARNKLLTSNLKYMCKMANKYRNRGVPFSYLISEANDALIYAIEKFDDKKDVKLFSYARWWVDAYLGKLTVNSKNSRTSEISEKENFNEENIEYIQEYPRENKIDVCENNNVSISEIKSIITELYTILDDREKTIISMKYGIEPYEKEYTLDEIGRKIGITKERVRQISEKALTKMRSKAMLNFM